MTDPRDMKQFRKEELVDRMYEIAESTVDDVIDDVKEELENLVSAEDIMAQSLYESVRYEVHVFEDEFLNRTIEDIVIAKIKENYEIKLVEK